MENSKTVSLPRRHLKWLVRELRSLQQNYSLWASQADARGDQDGARRMERQIDIADEIMDFLSA